MKTAGGIEFQSPPNDVRVCSIPDLINCSRDPTWDGVYISGKLVRLVDLAKARLPFRSLNVLWEEKSIVDLEDVERGQLEGDQLGWKKAGASIRTYAQTQAENGKRV